MKIMTRNLSRGIRFATVLLLSGTMALSAMAATVILTNGNRVEGTGIRATSKGDIILTTAMGQQTFPKGSYSKAIADKPAGFDQARTLASQGKFDEAIAILEKIAVEYRYLDWDNNSFIAIAQIQGSRGNHKEAVEVYDRLFRQAPDAKEDANVQWAYRGALLGAGSYDKLLPSLDAAIAKGSRADAARAQVMRGDVKAAQGQLDGAVMDYLRTAILFESEAAVQPEALFKAAQTLEQLRDPRAKDLYAKLLQVYPSSTYAEKAKGK